MTYISNEAVKRIMAKGQRLQHAGSTPFEMEATRSMVECDKFWCWQLSDGAKSFIIANDFAPMHLRFDEPTNRLIVCAHSDHERVMFRLAFA